MEWNANIIWMFPKIVGNTPKSSIKKSGFSIIFTIHFGIALFFGNTPVRPRFLKVKPPKQGRTSNQNSRVIWVPGMYKFYRWAPSSSPHPQTSKAASTSPISERHQARITRASAWPLGTVWKNHWQPGCHHGKVVVEPTHLKNIRQIGFIFPNLRGEHKK